MTNSARTFTASLKPAWDDDKIIKFLNDTKSIAKVWIINHDKDINEHGEIVEKHTHILLDYSTPRKIQTISNLLGVADNFIEIVRNKKGVLRYLTHIDDDDKYKYSVDEVFTNDTIPYAHAVLGAGLSDRDIAEYLMSGRGFELLGVVSGHRLRTIQSFLHFDMNKENNAIMKDMQMRLTRLTDALDKVESIAVQFISGLTHSAEQVKDGMSRIANEIKMARIKR